MILLLCGFWFRVATRFQMMTADHHVVSGLLLWKVPRLLMASVFWASFPKRNAETRYLPFNKIRFLVRCYKMAKLYCEISSERTGKHQIGNKFLEVRIYFGSKEDPKLLTHILVKPENNNQPVEFFQFCTQESKAMVLKQKPLESVVLQ